MKKWLPLLLAASYAVAFSVNVGHFAWSYPVGWEQITTSAIYAAAWMLCLIVYRQRERWMRAAMLAGGVMMVGGILGVLVRALGSTGLTIPALLTAGVAITPLYGLLSLMGDYDVFYLAAAVLGAGFCALAGFLRRKARGKGIVPEK